MYHPLAKNTSRLYCVSPAYCKDGDWKGLTKASFPAFP
jgi:hypothetical protein